jgi:PKD repeat protein
MANFVNGSRRLNALGALQQVQSYICDQDVPPVTNFNANNVSGCPGLSVTFNNLSSLNAESFEWQFPGGFPATSTEASPTVVYNTLGNYDVLLITSNGFGIDTLIRPNYISVNSNGIVIAYDESFENGTLSESGWSVVNPDNANTWQKFTVQGTTPGNQAVGVNIFNNAANAGQRDRLISPAIALNQTSNNTLFFTHAHRRRSSNIRDSLIIYVSVDDGETFPFRIFGRAENGQGSFATAGLLTTNFVPTQTSDWCLAGTIGTACLSVNLSQFDGQTIKLAFEVLNNGGNNIYLDNIQIQ